MIRTVITTALAIWAVAQVTGCQSGTAPGSKRPAAPASEATGADGLSADSALPASSGAGQETDADAVDEPDLPNPDRPAPEPSPNTGGGFAVGEDCCRAADTFGASPSAGCGDPDIEACVCETIPQCCSDVWSTACVAAAVASCDSCPQLTDDDVMVAALLQDTDRDGLTDLEEILAALNPFWPFDGIDNDGDGVDNGEDDDVDGDGTFNAYDDDVDGDGIRNEDDDDIDGDGLLNDLLDTDDDGDGILDHTDNDDNANNKWDEIEDDDEDDGGGDDDEEGCKTSTECDEGSICQEGKCEVSLGIEEGGCLSSIHCGLGFICDQGICRELELESDECEISLSCGSGSVCEDGQCIEIEEECRRENDDDNDGLCNNRDPDLNNDGNLDDDDDDVLDLEEALRGTDPTKRDTDGDGVPDGEDFSPLNPDLSEFDELLALIEDLVESLGGEDQEQPSDGDDEETGGGADDGGEEGS